MKTKIFTKVILLTTICIFITISAKVYAQWSGVYGNEWLVGKYGQPWVRIGVTQNGVYKLVLPAAFQNSPGTLHLYHRGVEVRLLSATNTEIEFYGVFNDGASDALLYRLPTSRKNTNFSTFSDESAYFLTVDGNVRLATVQETLTPDSGLTPTSFHMQTFFKEFVIENSHMTSYPTRPVTQNSYFEEGKAGTGTRIRTGETTARTVNPKPTVFTNTYVAEPFAYQIKARFGLSAPKVNIRLKGRGYQFNASSNVEVLAGKNASSLRSTGTVTTTGFLDQDYNFDLMDVDIENEAGILGFKSTGSATDGFSISYYSLTYEQKIDMQGLNSYQFNFPASNTNTRFTIMNPPAGSLKFYDVTDADHPRVIIGNAADLMISRNGNPLKLLATNQSTSVSSQTVTFHQINPAEFDYLIVTNETLAGSAQTYADYRKNESPGKKYKPLVAKITDIYNQFNYGEPSPVGLRRFVDFMISDNNKNKYLLLLGKSTTYYERMIRELPDEVPTVGFPASDMLLVDGLRGQLDDVPAIPVGRIAAISDEQVNDYLDKVKTYESQADLSWRKNVIHINGGKATGEVAQFAKYLSDISPSIINSPFLGDTINKPKTQEINGTVIANITPEINGTAAAYPQVKGIGMITYFGHGNVDNTDYDFGYATDPAKAYNNNGKYPILFYNGCGVNNIFSNRYSPFTGTVPNSAGKRPLSLDWLLAKGKGAILVFGNDWDAYASTSNEYLDRLYPKIFSKSDTDRGTIGEILQAVALDTKLAKGYTYNIPQNARIASYYNADRANVHQVILQGDPALRILLTESALPVDLISFDAKLSEKSKVEVSWKTAWEKNNSHYIIERSYNARDFNEIGRVEGKEDISSESSYVFYDTDPLSGISYYRLKQVDQADISSGKGAYSKIVAVNRPETDLLVIYPNPISDWMEIKLDAPVKIKSWNILDITGRLIKEGGKELRCNLSSLPSGEYILKVFTENGDSYNKKVVKK